jgi:hypothetical protein
MKPIRIMSCWLLLVSWAVTFPARALDENGAKAVIVKFLGSQKPQDGASASEAEHVIADVNGDGKPDIILMWNVLGPTWFLPKLTLFIDQGRNYRALTADLSGQTQKLAVSGSTIAVDTLMPGPNDPRCCPTKKVRLRYQWTGSKLVMLR